jgi:hypothetical protein
MVFIVTEKECAFAVLIVTKLLSYKESFQWKFYF